MHPASSAPRHRTRDPLDAEARTRLGFANLTADQRAAIDPVLQGRDTLAVMPTGSGKSAIYQLAGSLVPGPTVVISPLIGLQQDQLDGLRTANAGRAEALNGYLGARRRGAVLDAIASYPLGAPVNHVLWGPGTVERHEPGIVTVRFHSVGYRQLALDLVTEGDLLRLAAAPGPDHPSGQAA
jgi:superfamily II DNA helicase RecQ